MTKSARLEVRVDPDLLAELQEFAASRPGSVAEHVRYAVRLYLDVQSERKERAMDEFVSYMETEDRVAQVNHLQEIAGNIRAGGVGDGTPAEQVAYYTKNHKLPSWFDPHDYHLLTEFVADPD